MEEQVLDMIYHNKYHQLLLQMNEVQECQTDLQA